MKKGEIYTMKRFQKRQDQAPVRLVLVLSDEEANRETSGVVVSFLSNQIREETPFLVPLSHGWHHSCVVADRLVTVTSNRLGRRVGVITRQDMTRVEAALCRLMDL